MLQRANLAELDKHIQRASRDLGQACFLVGGSVRDVLCGWTIDPTDIDVTCAGDPNILYAALEKREHNVGLFRTEKYGTMTWTSMYASGEIVDQSHEDTTETRRDEKLWVTVYPDDKDAVQGDEKDLSAENGMVVDLYKLPALHVYTYECTPFRTEGLYTDARHPDQVQRTTSLLADSRRRDFTVNALYYTIVGTPTDSVGASLVVDEQQIARQLEKQGWTYIVGASLLVVQSEELIDRLTSGEMTIDSLQAFFSDVQVPVDCTQGVRVMFDPAHGIDDILNRKLRTVGDPDQRFAEDALRILRAARFVNIRNQHHGIQFDFHKDTWTSMQKNVGLVASLAKERLHSEIVKVFMKRNPFGYIALLDELDLLKTLFPTLYRCKHNDQPIRYHPFDTYAHTMLTLRHLQQINDDYLVKLAMLYHDVGKPDQYAAYAAAETPEARAAIHGSPLNHAISGQVFVHKEFAALGFSFDEMEEIAWYVGMHMRPGQILEAAPENQRKKLRLLYSEAGYARVRNLLDVTVADRRGQFNPIQGTEIDAVDALYVMLDDLRDTEGQFTMRELAVNGSDIMEHFQLAPGPHIGKLLGFAFQWVIHEKEARNKKTSILSFLKGCIPTVDTTNPISSVQHDDN